jgi:hypothetical protein
LTGFNVCSASQTNILEKYLVTFKKVIYALFEDEPEPQKRLQDAQHAHFQSSSRKTLQSKQQNNSKIHPMPTNSHGLDTGKQTVISIVNTSARSNTK